MARVDAVPRPAGIKGLAARQRYWGIVFALLLIIGLGSLGLYLFSRGWAGADGNLPVGLRSPLRANYAMDPQQFSLLPLNAGIVEEALSDRSGPEASGGSTNQLSTLMVALSSPVPSVTPLAGSTAVTAPLSSPTSLPTWIILTATEGADASPTPEPPVSPTAFFTAWPTSTLRPYATATHHVITVVPTYYPTLARTATSTATKTQPALTITSTKTPPAATQAPSQTAQPTKEAPTNTPKATATPDLTGVPTKTPTKTPSATIWPTATYPYPYPPPPPVETTPPAYP